MPEKGLSLTFVKPKVCQLSGKNGFRLRFICFFEQFFGKLVWTSVCSGIILPRNFFL